MCCVIIFCIQCPPTVSHTIFYHDMQFQKCIVNTCAVGPIGSGKKLN